MENSLKKFFIDSKWFNLDLLILICIAAIYLIGRSDILASDGDAWVSAGMNGLASDHTFGSIVHFLSIQICPGHRLLTVDVLACVECVNSYRHV